MKILYVKNGSTRSKEFQLTTTIYERDGQRYIEKRASNQDSIAHLQKMKDNYSRLSTTIINPRVKLAKVIDESSDTLTFEYIDGISLQKKFFRALDSSRDEAKKVISEYIELISTSFATKSIDIDSVDDRYIEIFSDHFIEGRELVFDGVADIDLIFSNIIYRGDDIYIIDYEWVFDLPISVDFVTFRAVNSLSQDWLLDEFFTKEQLRVFREQESSFILNYALNSSSFYQLQHYYLKDKSSPTRQIEERDRVISMKDSIIDDKDRYIEDLISQIAQLKEIAQSLRIKNRLKRLAPDKLIKPIKSIKNNPALLKKVIYYAKRGEFAYIWNKAKQKSNSNISQALDIEEIDPFDYFRRFSIDDYSMGDRVIDVIIPVYNGYEFLDPLFDSIERNTTTPYRLIVVNDSSPDERVKPLLLKRLESHPNSTFVDHETNLGFVKSVNEAYSYTKDHFLILNTDTEVPPYWIERLMHPILNMDRVATTTPFTNSGQIASFPNFIADNDIFEGMSVDDLDSVFRDINPEKFYAKAPTGVGFCMGINYDLIQEIGFFVEEEFGRGYGEENDWCQRAIIEGYSNLIVPNLFVYHKHGGSFSAEDKQRLMKENAIKLLHRHPNYDKDVERYVEQDIHKTLREIAVVVASSKDNEAIHLIVDHALGGGANHYTNELVERYQKENKKILRAIYDYYLNSYIIYFDYRDYHFSFKIKEFDKLVEFLSYIKLQEIILNNLVSFRDIDRLLDWVTKSIEGSDTTLTIPIHDYYIVCPNYTLLDPNGDFCKIPSSLQSCQECIRSNDLEWRTFVTGDIDIYNWRKEWGRVVELADKIVCFSHSSKELILRAYDHISREKIEVTPHYVEPLKAIDRVRRGDKPYTTIGILGAINQAKGASIIEDLLKSIDKEDLQIKVVLIGEISTNISSKNFLVTGRYDRDDLPRLVVEHDIDIFLLPSVCPETFSYTTQEIIMMQMPLMVFDIGAPAERVKEYDKGVVLEREYIPNIINYIEKFEA
jgi:GT2 family glycosyltransferase